ncbi:MAG: hypothetical protein QM302_00120 [Acidobacteriota bacterium]|nr:hypothetical protein [Acidobacteriota bacterium]
MAEAFAQIDANIACNFTAANPYGYVKEPFIDEFLGCTSSEAYEDMLLFMKLSFEFDVFEKNMVFIIERVAWRCTLPAIKLPRSKSSANRASSIGAQRSL